MNIVEVIDNAQFLVDSEGNRKSVMLDYRLWEKLCAELLKANKTIEELRHRQMSVSDTSAPPKNFEGWTVYKQKRGGFLSLFRKINHRTISVYIGKDWNEDAARKKIAEQLARHGLISKSGKLKAKRK